MPAGKITTKRDKISKIYGLGIGINKFKNGIAPLEGCVRDATEIMKAFAPFKAKLLLDEDATRENIFAAITHYTETLKKGDLLVMSVSAHGALINKVNKDLAICPYDTDQRNMLGTVVSAIYLLNALCDISENGCKVLLILDVCHSGAIGFDLSKYSGLLSGGGISAIYACGPNERSQEMSFEKETEEVKNDLAEKNETPKEPKKKKASSEKQGVFTKFLVDGLNGGAMVKDSNTVTLRNLYDFVYQNVCQIRDDQHPALIGTLEGNIVLKTS